MLETKQIIHQRFSETALELLYCCCKHKLTIYDITARDLAKEANQLMLLTDSRKLVIELEMCVRESTCRYMLCTRYKLQALL